MDIEVIGYELSQWDSQERVFILKNNKKAVELEMNNGILGNVGTEEEVKEAIKEYIIKVLPTDDGLFNLMAEPELGDLSDLTLEEKNAQYGEQLKQIIRDLDGEWSAYVEE